MCPTRAFVHPTEDFRAVTTLTATLIPERRRSPWTMEARALVGLALPLAGAQLAQMAVMTTDVILLGRFSRSALAAAAIGNTIYFLAWLMGGGPASAVSPMIAHLIGERPRARGGVRASFRMGVWAILLSSAPMMIVMQFADPILRALGQDPRLSADAGKFVSVLALGLPFTLGFVVLRNFSNALGRPRAGLWVMLATIAFNALAGWTLIFGHFGAPRLGIVGSAAATAGSSVFSFLAMAAIVWATPTLRAYRVFRRFHRPARAKLAEVFRLGLPIGMTMIFEAMMFNTMTLVMGRFGAGALAAHQIALNFASVTFMIPLGIGMASTVRVGMATGAGDRDGARRAGLTAFGLSLVFVVICGVGMALFGREIAGGYIGGRTAADLQVTAITATFLQVAAAFQLFDSLQVVGAQALRGLKDARMPMILAAFAYWLIGAPTCLALAFWAHLGGLGIWIGLAVGLAAAAVLMCSRFFWLTRRLA